MSQENNTENKKSNPGKSDLGRSKKKKDTERRVDTELDKELEMTFPASDALAITQPGPEKKPTAG